MATKKITKLVIPAAGFGTRFLPATKSVAKEMIPILNVPTIHYLVQEALDSGVEEIIIVVSSQKNAIIDYFDHSFELETVLKEKNKVELYKLVTGISNMANIVFVRQKKAKGLGDAISYVRQIVNNEPFAVILGDDVVFTEKKQPSAIKQCIDAYYKHKCSILGVQPVTKEKTKLYGIVQPQDKKITTKTFKIKDMVEKPSVDQAPSNYAALGRYVLTPDVFDALAKSKPDKSGEIQLTDALQEMAHKQGMLAVKMTGIRFDAGDWSEYLSANIYFGLQDEDLHYELLNKLKNFVQFN